MLIPLKSSSALSAICITVCSRNLDSSRCRFQNPRGIPYAMSEAASANQIAPVYSKWQHYWVHRSAIDRSQSSVAATLSSVTSPGCKRTFQLTRHSTASLTYRSDVYQVAIKTWTVEIYDNAKNFICKLSRFTSSDFGATHSWNLCRSPKSRQSQQNLYLGVQNYPRSMLSMLSISRWLSSEAVAARRTRRRLERRWCKGDGPP